MDGTIGAIRHRICYITIRYITLQLERLVIANNSHPPARPPARPSVRSPIHLILYPFHPIPYPFHPIPSIYTYILLYGDLYIFMRVGECLLTSPYITGKSRLICQFLCFRDWLQSNCVLQCRFQLYFRELNFPNLIKTHDIESSLILAATSRYDDNRLGRLCVRLLT